MGNLGKLDKCGALRKNRILVVEDEQDVRDLMALHLEREGYDCLCATDGEEAMRYFEAEELDLAVLDWMLPGVSGLDLCRQMSARIPILMVTARADTSDVVIGLESGAYDYITKPFDIPIFLARIRSILRRCLSSLHLDGKYQCGSLKLNLSSHHVTCGESEIQLTVSEFKLLAALMKHRGLVLTRDRLIEMVQGEGISVIDRAIDTHIFGVRKKLGCCADIIETIRGVGYRIKG